MSKIPVYLVTGFLGSGKTTFIDRILQTFDRIYRIGIVQNEFAPANIDGTELRNNGRSFEMLEINNGSVFCICLLGDFTRSLATFIDEKKPDLVFIEASGLSDPASIIEVMQNPLLQDLIYLRETWCIIDARYFLSLESMLNRIHHQILIADRIIINKKDLATVGVISGIRKYISGLNPFAILYESTYCGIDFTPVNIPDFIPQAIHRRQEMRDVEQSRPDMGVGVFKTGMKISFSDLDELVRYYAMTTARMKGNVLLVNGHTALVQTVFKDININLAQHNYGNTCLVIMGEDFNLSEFSKKFRALTA
ncbi:MAG: GTP-binding protein [Cyclobacteriaceae bacterium]|nr:GTP-binding protein [Cyclobacteriaceae bacterium]